MMDSLRALAQLNGRIARACLRRAERQADLPMPGYTHLQRAVPSSVGLWMAGFAEAFIDNLELAGNTADLMDSSPLGTAAGYGVNLPLDRAGVARELGFKRLQINPVYAQNSRGKFEMMALQAALHAMQDLRRLAWDLISGGCITDLTILFDHSAGSVNKPLVNWWSTQIWMILSF